MSHRCRADTVAHEPGMISAQGYDQLRQPDTVSLCSSTEGHDDSLLGKQIITLPYKTTT
jgi:hypothetical protein